MANAKKRGKQGQTEACRFLAFLCRVRAPEIGTFLAMDIVLRTRDRENQDLAPRYSRFTRINPQCTLEVDLSIAAAQADQQAPNV